MNNGNFEMTNLVGRELTEEELMTIQGGNIFGDIGNWVKDRVNDVGEAISKGAKAVAEGLANRALADAKRFFSRWF
jgi:bacteriocin-like protein